MTGLGSVNIGLGHKIFISSDVVKETTKSKWYLTEVILN